jgi:hypothetical protein
MRAAPSRKDQNLKYSFYCICIIFMPCKNNKIKKSNLKKKGLILCPYPAMKNETIS